MLPELLVMMTFPALKNPVALVLIFLVLISPGAVSFTSPPIPIAPEELISPVLVSILPIVLVRVIFPPPPLVMALEDKLLV